MDKSPPKTELTKPMPKFQPAREDKNEGEGNRTADRRYREHVSRHVKSGQSAPAADEARRAVEGEEADDLREAELAGKARAAADDEPEDSDRDPELEEDIEDQQAREDQGQRSQR